MKFFIKRYKYTVLFVKKTLLNNFIEIKKIPPSENLNADTSVMQLQRCNMTLTIISHGYQLSEHNIPRLTTFELLLSNPHLELGTIQVPSSHWNKLFLHVPQMLCSSSLSQLPLPSQTDRRGIQEPSLH